MKKTNNLILRIIAMISAINLLVFTLYSCSNDASNEVKAFIDKHSYTMHQPPSGWGGLEYKDILISDTKNIGIGYFDDSFCLHSIIQEKTYVANLRWFEYTVYCEIMFEWDEFGGEDFFAMVIFENNQNLGHTVGYAEVSDWSNTTTRKPHFTKVEVLDNSTEFNDKEIENIASLVACNLVWDVNDYLDLFSLPTF